MKSLIKSISMGPFGSDVKVEYLVDKGVPFLDGSNLTSVKMNGDNLRFVTREKADSLQNALVHPGDIVVTHRGTIGQISYVPYDLPYDEFLISQSQFRVSLDTDKVNPIWFAYYFHTNEGKKRLLSFANYVGVPALATATTNFRNLEIPLPEKKIQDEIASILVHIQDKIEINNSLSYKLESLASMIYDYWFLQFDFPDENGRPYRSSGGKMIWNAELKREIPEGWKVKDIEHLSKCVKVGFVGPVDKYYCSEEEGIPIVRPAEMTTDGIDYSSLKYITHEFFERNKKSQVHYGDILISRCGKDGIPNIYDKKSDAQVLNAVIIEPDDNTLFLYQTLKTDYSQKQIELGTGGSIQGVINTKTMAQVKVICSMDVIRRYEITIRKAYHLVKLCHEENRRLASLRDFLLPLLMNGQVTFKEAESKIKHFSDYQAVADHSMVAEQDTDYGKKGE